MKNIKTAALMVTVLLAAAETRGQSIEAVGTRALGMGGAFVGVADDASATYWNPAGLASGPTFSTLFDGNTSDLVPGGAKDALITPETRAQELSTRALALTTPALGVSYYRLRTVTLGGPAGTSSGDREEEGLGSPEGAAQTFHQFGVTLVQSLGEGITVGTTLKLVRGQVARTSVAVGTTVDEALDRTGELERKSTNKLDLDAGVMFAAGPVRVGVVGRNLREPEFEVTATEPPVVLERQVRLGVAVTPGHIAQVPGAPTTVALDIDLQTTLGVFGEQKQVAFGGEQWFANRRIGVRAGLRVNWLRREERSGSVGMSVAVRTGTYVEGQITRGKEEFERGWSIATRTSF